MGDIFWKGCFHVLMFMGFVCIVLVCRIHLCVCVDPLHPTLGYNFVNYILTCYQLHWETVGITQ
jgi:hypothetical protein